MSAGKWIASVVCLAAGAGLAVVVAAGVQNTTQATGGGVPEFLRVGRCYRWTFAVAAAPTWKVLERLDNGWIKAELDAGSASAVREPVWVNTAQILTSRDVRCSD